MLYDPIEMEIQDLKMFKEDLAGARSKAQTPCYKEYEKITKALKKDFWKNLRINSNKHAINKIHSLKKNQGVFIERSKKLSNSIS
ncbi:MAG: hypothetical protein QW265_04150 [Candidatus Bathyarchaeia archaeon]